MTDDEIREIALKVFEVEAKAWGVSTQPKCDDRALIDWTIMAVKHQLEAMAALGYVWQRATVGVFIPLGSEAPDAVDGEAPECRR